MSLDELDAFLAADPAAKRPSDLQLDQLAAGEIQGEAARAIEAEVADDPALANDLKRRRLGTAAVTEVDTAALLARIKGELGAAKPAREGLLTRLLKARWFAPGLVIAGATAAAVIISVRPPDPTGSAIGPPSGIRMKGALRLQVIRQTPTGSERMISGATFKPGDTLRFRVDAPGAGTLQIVGVEGDGTLYTAWPLPEHAAQARLAEAARDLLLDGSVELDATAGREVLHLVHCPPGVEPGCTSAGADAAPTCAAGCVSSPFTLEKRP